MVERETVVRSARGDSAPDAPAFFEDRDLDTRCYESGSRNQPGRSGTDDRDT
jgi:hypothetical protein